MNRRLIVILLLAVGAAVAWWTLGRNTPPAAHPPVSLPAIGSTTPRTSPPAPSTTSIPPASLPDGVRVEVGDDLQAAIDAHPAGTTYVIAAGIHRLQVATPKDGDRFFGEPGAILNGAKVLTEFTRFEGHWVAEGQDQERPPRDLRCIEGYSGCQHSEDLFIDGVMLWQVTDLADLGPGTWYFDYEADRIHLFDDPSGRRVEASIAAVAAFNGPADDVHVEGLIVEMYETGIRAFEGRRWTIVGNETRLNHGNGIRAGSEARIIGNYTHHNGAYGMSAFRANDLLVQDNEIAYNNTAGFEPAWDAGGTKFGECEGIRIVGNHVHHNFGTGLWVDGSNTGVVYEDNLVEHNERHGISHEISYAAVIRNNVVRNNGLYGIFVSGSPDVEIVGNEIVDNAVRAVWGFYDPVRGEGPLGPFEVRNLDVHDNRIVSSTGITGIDHKGPDPGIYDEWNNRFHDNEYVVSADADLFLWDGSLLTFAEWQAQGNDAGSVRIDP